MQLSKREYQAYKELKRNNMIVFRVKDICLLLNIGKTKAYNVIKALKKKGAVKNVGKHFFAVAEADEFVIGQAINHPSYLSFWSALSYYGFSDQLPKKIFFAATRYAPEINNFKYITIVKHRFFGYTRIGELVIAEKEKAMIDSLLFPKYAGGIKEILTCFQSARGHIDVKKLIDYALKMKSKAVVRRLGFILESEKYTTKLLNKLVNNIGKGYELLDPSQKKKNNLNKRWLLDVNH